MSVPWATMAHKSGCADAIVRPGSLEHLGRGLWWAPSYQAQATTCHGRPRIGFLAHSSLGAVSVTASLLLFLVIARRPDAFFFRKRIAWKTNRNPEAD